MKNANFKHITIILIVMAVALLLTAKMEMDLFVNEDHTKLTTYEIPRLNLTLSADRELYHSSEEMNVNATIKTSTEAENLTIRIYGVKDGRGNFRVMEERNITVEPHGVNEVFSFRMPSCYGCAGVSPGEYEIMMEVLRNGTIIGNCSKTVKLEK